jgi:DNA-binding LytR/AlgR family response regulator
MANILIVEVDKIQRKNFINIIKEGHKDIDIFEAESENEALIIANERNIDIFYMDISLKDSSGLNLAHKLRKIEKYKLSWIIFVTTFKQHMLFAFKEIHCYDYIIKPYSKAKVLELTKTLVDYINIKLQVKSDEGKCIFLNQNKISFKIYTEDIYFIEAFFKDSIVHAVDGEYVINRTSLKTITEMMCDIDYIVQAHRSYIINLKRINKIEKESSTSWIAYFEGYNKFAFIGSKYKANVDKYFYNLINEKTPEGSEQILRRTM